MQYGHFIIYLMALWWAMWLALALTPLNIFRPPSREVTAQFGALILFFLAGHAFARVMSRRPSSAVASERVAAPLKLHRSLHLINGLCLLILLLSLHLSGAFTEGFIEYFAKLRRDEMTGDTLTGSSLLDVATKAIVFPASYTVTIVVLATRIGPHRWVLALSALNVILFSYLWQVNYSLIHLFWFFAFYVLVGFARGVRPDGKTLLFVLSLIALLVAVAAYRFGGDVVGGLQRYVFGYHMAGFSFYDHQYRDVRGLLHDHSFGRSSLGFIEQFAEIISRRIDLGFVAASSENANYNGESVELGANETISGNAFGTFLFGFYRDFAAVGIAVGGFLYGAFSTHLLMRGRHSWPHMTVFCVLGTSWMMGMMVNPVEQAYFWFAILLIAALAKLNRGFKL